MMNQTWRGIRKDIRERKAAQPAAKLAADRMAAAREARKHQEQLRLEESRRQAIKRGAR